MYGVFFCWCGGEKRWRGPSDNASSVIVRTTGGGGNSVGGGIDLSHHHPVVSGCRLVDGPTPPMRVPCLSLSSHGPAHHTKLSLSLSFHHCPPTLTISEDGRAKSRGRLASLGCRSSRASSASRSIPLPHLFFSFVGQSSAVLIVILPNRIRCNSIEWGVKCCPSVLATTLAALPSSSSSSSCSSIPGQRAISPSPP